MRAVRGPTDNVVVVGTGLGGLSVPCAWPARAAG